MLTLDKRAPRSVYTDTDPAGYRSSLRLVFFSQSEARHKWSENARSELSRRRAISQHLSWSSCDTSSIEYTQKSKVPSSCEALPRDSKPSSPLIDELLDAILSIEDDSLLEKKGEIGHERCSLRSARSACPPAAHLPEWVNEARNRDALSLAP